MAAQDIGQYAPADFGDAQEEQPAAAAFDIGGHGSSTPYSNAVNAIAAKHMEEARTKTINAINLPSGWKKRFRDFISTKNGDLLDFLKGNVSAHPVLGPAEILLRRFGNPQATPTHPSVREFILDISGADHLDTINRDIDLSRGAETGLRAHAIATQYLYEQYRGAGDDILKAQASLKAKLEKLDRIQGRITNIFDIDPNVAYPPLMEAAEDYLKRIFQENQIEEEYKTLIKSYKTFVSLRDSIHLLRAPSAIENEPLCTICLTDSVSYAFSPCGHTFCQTCVRRQAGQCPICRATIRDRLKLYFS
jgi:hypothetical protein